MFWIVSLPQNFLLGIQLTPHVVLELLQSIFYYQFPSKIYNIFMVLWNAQPAFVTFLLVLQKKNKVFAVGPRIRFYFIWFKLIAKF